MSAESDLRALLANHTGVAALVGSRIALNAVPESSAYPLIVFDARHDRIYGIQGQLLADEVTFAIQCWADTAAAAEAVADAVTDALGDAPMFAGATVLDRSTAFDAELGLDSVVLTVSWWAA